MSEKTVARRQTPLKYWLGKAWIFLGMSIILMAIVFSIFRALTPWARQYKPTVEQQLSQLLGQPVSIESMSTSWYWFKPVLQLNHVRVVDNHKKELTVQKLLVGIDLLRSLIHRQIQPGILYMGHAHIHVQQQNGQWLVDGLNLQGQAATTGKEAYVPIFDWLSAQGRVIIRHISLDVQLQDGTVLPHTHLDVTLQNQAGWYRIKGLAKLMQAIPTEVSIATDLYLDPHQLNKTKGRVYLSVKSLALKQWQRFMPHLSVMLDEGQGNATLWLDFKNGQLLSGQSLFDVHQLVLKREGKVKPLRVESLSSNVGWKRTKRGWELSGNHFKLNMNGFSWPENEFYVHFNDEMQSHRVYFKYVLLTPLLALDIPWPEAMKPLLAMKPRGRLSDTEVEVKDGHVDYLLAGFSNLSWLGRGVIPGVKGLSGALYWQPMEGRLELDSQDTEITLKKQTPLLFSKINTAIEWKPLSHGTRVSLENIVIVNSDLTFSASGVMDEPEAWPSSHAHLVAKWSASQVEQWLTYLSMAPMKPKLKQWLMHNIKHIGKASGRLTIDGNMADFPFDNKNGQFEVVSYLNGVELLISPQWPLCKAIDAQLQFNHRNLNVDIQHAELKEVVVDAMNLHIDDIGRDRETLLLHGKVNAEAKSVMSYVFDSPLRQSLSRLKYLVLEGMLGIDLTVEVPLYPENDNALTQGTITFDNNQLQFQRGFGDLTLDHVMGEVTFNEKGIGNSELTATLAGDPVTIHVASVTEPKPLTRVTFDVNTSVEVLRNVFHQPWLALMKGDIALEGNVDLGHVPNASDQLTIQSSLQGVRINLPSPLGKAANDIAPLSIVGAFSEDEAMQFRIAYSNRLNADLRFRTKKGAMTLDRGVIRLGEGAAEAPQAPGLKLTGTLNSFKDAVWRSAFSTLPQTSSSMDIIQAVDMSFGDLAVGQQRMKNVSIKANRLDHHEWAIQLSQSDMTADVRYQPDTNTIKGKVARLHLDNNSQVYSGKAPVSPEFIPNLQLTIDQLIYGDIDVGQVVLDSQSSKSGITINSCSVTTPYYQLAMKGKWVKQPLENRTTIQADLSISKLGKSLDHWHMAAAVKGRKGQVSFTGGWPGAFWDASLRQIEGKLQIQLNDGRITDLSPETEKKLGLGKLLSILSLQTIPRRLKLDFSDLSKRGYSFDVFKGDFTLSKGVMNTSDSYIDGPVAYASMKGDLDLVKRWYDLDLHVSPHIAASLPVVATIAGGGPIAGIATWVAIKIINKGMQNVTGYTYRVTGPWADPVVQQVTIYKKQP